MAQFFAANAGLASRFPNKFEFADYSVDELVQIAHVIVDAASFELSDEPDAAEALRRLVEPVPRELPCGNARSVENRIAAAISAQSTRLNGAPCQGASLFQLAAADLDAAAAMANRAAAVLGPAPPKPGGAS